MQSKPTLILGWLGVVNGAALVAVPRVLSLDDSFGDKARIFAIVGGSLCVIGLVMLLGLTKAGKEMSAQQSGTILARLGMGLIVGGVLLEPLLSQFGLSKAWGFLMLPFVVVGLSTLILGMIRRRRA